MIAQTPITEAEIACLVDGFYEKVHVDPCSRVARMNPAVEIIRL
jgi:hypothetical protein